MIDEKTKLQTHLLELRACQEARTWAEGKTAKQAWARCRRPDWLLWWAGRTQANTKMQLVRAACDCAWLVLHLVPAGKNRPRLAIEAAETWADNPTIENLELVRVAGCAAAAYAASAAADAASAAAYAASAAADAASAAAYAADAAAYAASAAAYAASAAAREQARAEMRAMCCKAIRRRLTIPWTERKPSVKL